MGKKELRVLQLGKFYPVRGGVEKVAYDLMVGLSERHIGCDMMCAASQGRSRILNINEYANIICCHTWMKLAATMISPAMIFSLWKRCRQYDVIQIHHPDPMACMALFLSGYRGKVVLHWHSDIVKQRVLLRLYRPFLKWLIRRADRIVGTTPVYLDSSPMLRAVQDKTLCIPIGIRPLPGKTAAADAVRACWPGKKLVFTLGRLIRYKGQKYLVDAARYLGDDYIVLIGGTGPLHKSLLEQIRDAGLESKVKLLGFIPDETVSDWYNACDIFCLSSIERTEAFGIVQIEAMSCGKPVVATTIPGSGVSWVNENGYSGINVPPEDPKALAEAIMQIMSSPEVYSEYSRNAVKRYRSQFSAEKMIGDSMALYEKILKI